MADTKLFNKRTERQIPENRARQPENEKTRELEEWSRTSNICTTEVPERQHGKVMWRKSKKKKI